MAASEIRRRKKPKASVNETSTSPLPTTTHSEKKDVQTSENRSAPSTNSSSAYDEYAWFLVFLLATSYFVLTRTGSTNRNGLLSKFSKPYEVVATSVIINPTGDRKKNEDVLKSIFYIQKGSSTSEASNELPLSYPLEIIISSPPDIYHNTNNTCPTPSCINDIPFLSHLASTAWVHDSELGRGYLLLADVGRSGRIWRWEVGGGPITIGRSLHMEKSGCRSGIWAENGRKCPENLFGSVGAEREMKEPTLATSEADHGNELHQSTSLPPLLGTASIVVELTRDAERSTESKNILVAEWGERRIVRVEGETAAPTPIVTMLPGQGGDLRRLFRTNHLMHTPFGDLMFSDSYEGSNERQVSAIYRLRDAVHVLAISVERWCSERRTDLEHPDATEIVKGTNIHINVRLPLT